jgi:hypothetical protein
MIHEVIAVTSEHEVFLVRVPLSVVDHIVSSLGGQVPEVVEGDDEVPLGVIMPHQIAAAEIDC